MKNLFYKEIKLSIHPLCYVFVVGFALMGFIPSYPPTVSYIYTIASYTFLFLGANKAQTTNDLFYTLNLPIVRKDVVKARMFSIGFLQLLTTIPLFLCLLGRELFVTSAIIADGGETLQAIDVYQLPVLIGIITLSFTIIDSIYVPWFYKTGKSIVGPTLVAALVGTLLLIGLPVGLAYIPGFIDIVTMGSPNANYYVQFGAMGFGIVCYIISRIVITKSATKNLEKLDY